VGDIGPFHELGDPFIAPDGFQQPRWLSKGERKHIPESNASWEILLERSQGREGDAWYHPNLAHSRIQRIEMDTVRDTNEVLSKRRGHVRYYWRHVGFLVGASKGEPTEYVYVNYAQEGAVHGYPITVDGLREKGVRV
jgi:hypothetical protein